jgi:hypothetical protein
VGSLISVCISDMIETSGRIPAIRASFLKPFLVGNIVELCALRK